MVYLVLVQSILIEVRVYFDGLGCMFFNLKMRRSWRDYKKLTEMVQK